MKRSSRKKTRLSIKVLKPKLYHVVQMKPVELGGIGERETKKITTTNFAYLQKNAVVLDSKGHFSPSRIQ